MSRHLETWKRGKAAVGAYFKRAGYHIIKRNYRCRLGEVDIIAEEDVDIVFVEVRSMCSTQFGDPAASVSTLRGRIYRYVPLIISRHAVWTAARRDLILSQ